MLIVIAELVFLIGVLILYVFYLPLLIYAATFV